MRKLIFTVLLAISMTMAAQETGKNYVRQGNVFTQVVKKGGGAKKSAEARKTGMKWKDSKGKEYDIMMSSRGSCFVMKVSGKTGKEYKYYLGPELSQEVCKSLKVEYKGKAK